MDHGAHLPALSPSSSRIGERLEVHRSRCAGRANAATPAADRDKQRVGRPPPASSSTAHASTSRPAGEQQRPPIPRNAAASGSPRSDRGEGDTDKRSAHRRRDIGQYAPGSPGTGKTGLALGLLRAACLNGHRGRFYNAQVLLDELYASLADRTTTRLLGQLSRMQPLLIDELGYLTIKPEQANAFFRLISRRGRSRDADVVRLKDSAIPLG